MSANAEQLDAIFDVDAQSFQTLVLDASHRTPVLVDFWAEWCAPCKALGPVLEQVVGASNGAVRLAKIDIDSNQEFAGSNGIRSIPTVRLFVDGAAVAEFMGAQPEQAINAFLKQHLPDSESNGDTTSTPNVEQVVQALLKDQHFEQAAQVLQDLPETDRESPAMQSLAVRVDIAARAAKLPAIDELETLVMKDSADFGSRLALSTRQAERGDYDNAMEGLLLILSRERNFSDGAARKELLTIFDALGANDARVNQFRALLANVLN